MPLSRSDGLPPEKLLDNRPGGLRLLYERSPQTKSPGAVQRSTLPQRFPVPLRSDRGFKKSGKSIAAYGAAAKGTTLLNYAGIGNKLIDFVVDKSTYKQGKYMPGVHLPIFPPSRLLEVMPDCTLLLAWNFADEIQKQQAEYLRRGGRFIIPIPEPIAV